MSVVEVPESLLEAVARRIAPPLLDELRTLGLGNGPRWVDAEGAAAYLAFSESKIRKLTTQNAIPHHHHDGRVHYRTDELDAWLSEH